METEIVFGSPEWSVYMLTTLVAVTQGRSHIRQTTSFNFRFSLLFLIIFVELLFDANDLENRKPRANTSPRRQRNKPNDGIIQHEFPLNG